MQQRYAILIPTLWILWGVYWWFAARNVKRTVWREPLASRLLHIVPLTLAVLLLALPELPIAGLDARFLPRAAWLVWLGAALTAAGLLFCVWARRLLGRNWSGMVTLKEGHELITSGPYRWVRHPIYTGLLLGFAGSAIARGEWRGVLALLIVAAALWRKLKVEEQGMRQIFGDAYDAYSRRVAALIPLLL